jgi:hypothetical protein
MLSKIKHYCLSLLNDDYIGFEVNLIVCGIIIWLMLVNLGKTAILKRNEEKNWGKSYIKARNFTIWLNYVDN